MIELIFVLLIIAWAFVVPILGLVAFFKSLSLDNQLEKSRTEIYKLRQEISQLKKTQPQVSNQAQSPTEATHIVKSEPLKEEPEYKWHPSEKDISQTEELETEKILASDINNEQAAPPEEDVEQTVSQDKPKSKRPEQASPLGAEQLEVSAAQQTPLRNESALYESPNAPHFQADAEFEIEPTLSSQFFDWLKENWTGFLGVSILVLGVAFAAIYFSFNTSPIVRFLELVGVSVLFLGGSYILKDKPDWSELSGWLLAASGAVILFSVVGTGYFEGLKFYESALTGLSLLVLALSYNVVLAYLASKQTIASLHVIISLLALCVAPTQNVVFLSAVVVALSGVGLSLRQHWNINLILTLLAFSIFHFVWIMSLDNTQIADFAYIGFGGSIAIGGACLLAHYREIYQAKLFKQSLLVHTLTWFLIGIQLLWYIEHVKYIFIPLALMAGLGYGLAYCAKKKQLSNLFTTDLLGAQIFTTITIFSLFKLDWGLDLMAWLAAIQALCLAVLAYVIRETTVSKIIGYLGCALSILAGFYVASNYPDVLRLYVLGASFAGLTYGLRWYLQTRNLQQDFNIHKEWANYFSVVLDFITLYFATILLWLAIPLAELTYMALVLVVLTLGLNKVLFKSQWHRLFYYFFIAEMVIYSWVQLFGLDDNHRQFLLVVLPTIALLAALLPLKIFEIEFLVYSQDSARASTQDIQSEKIDCLDIWCYLIGIYTAISLSYYVAEFNSFLPGLLLLALGLTYWEGAHQLWSKNPNEKIAVLGAGFRNMAMLCLFGFIGLYLLLYLATQATAFGFISMRLLMSILVVCIGLYWLFSNRFTDTLQTYSERWSVRVAQRLHSLNFDIAILFLLIIVITEFSAPIHPLGYCAIAAVCLMPKFSDKLPSRKYNYSIFLLWAVCLQVAIVSSQWASPSSNWYQMTHITGPLSMVIALSLSYQIFQLSQNNENKGYMIQFFDRNIILLTFLPAFIALALFLLWRFDKAYLTMSWVIEIFLMISFALMLRYKPLVHIAFAFLGFCVLRLVFYDLAQTDLLIRAIVFVVVGLLMIAIHMSYKKYAGRFS